MAYATTTDLASYLGVTVASLPTNSAILLERASELIDYYTFNKIQVSIPTEANVAKRATCQQVEYWFQVGEDNDVTGNQYKQISIGTWNASFRDDFKMPTIAPRAKRTLFLGGMLFRGVKMI